MIKWWLLWVSISLLIVSCLAYAPPPKFYYTQHVPVEMPERIIPVYIENTFSETDRLEMQQAIDQWNEALNGHVKIIIAETDFQMATYQIKEAKQNNGWLFLKIRQGNPLIPSQSFSSPDQPQSFILAFTNRIGGDEAWFVRDAMPDEYMMYGVTLHEIGHLLGANHDGRYLMAPHYSELDFQCIDEGTMKQVSNNINVPIESLNYCLYERN